MGAFGENRIEHALIVDNCKFPIQTIHNKLLTDLKGYLTNISVQPYYYAKVKILIGQDNLNFIATREFIEISESLAVSRSLLGWALHGTTYRDSGTPYSLLSANDSSLEYEAMSLQVVDSDLKDTALDELIKRLFELESIGVSDRGKPKNSCDRAREILENSSKFKGHSWETGLLWKSEIPPEADSKVTAKKRLFALEKRLDREPLYADLFYKEMQRIIDQGYAVKLTGPVNRSRVWYVPIFGVYNINKPNKVRVVFDCAAKTRGISLNDQLDAGPDLLKSLPGIIIRFRLHAVAMRGDISDMFLRVKVSENDRAIRFLFRGKDRHREPDEYEATCLIFGSASSPTSANFIKNKNAERYQSTNPVAVNGIINDSYMDDLITSVKTEKDAVSFIKDVIKINAEAGFQMHGWASNETDVIKAAIGDAATSTIRDMPLNSTESERVLGIYWDTDADQLRFNVKLAKIPTEILNGEKVPTKREVLSVIMSIYDPLGLIAPFALKSKCLMQSIHSSGVFRDDQIRKEEYDQWLRWLAKLATVGKCKISRCYTTSGLYDKAQLHVFCDASLTAYAAAAYLRFDHPDGSACVALVMAKSRLAPMKRDTVPRLELQAALLGSRLAEFLKNEIGLEITRRYFWSDSSIVIQWVRSEPRKHNVFVDNRLKEIADLTQSTEWKWVPTDKNPADFATRLENNALESDSDWFNGPEFLKQDESTWPKETFVVRNVSEPQKTSVSVFTISTHLAALPLSMRLLGWQGVLVHARRVHRAFGIWRRKAHSKSKNGRIRENYHQWQATEKSKSLICRFNDWENYIYREMQAESFETELRLLTNSGQVGKQSKIAMLFPHLDENRILRAQGRVTNQSGHCNNVPIILDGKHPVARLLVAEYHRNYYHGSSNTVVNELRQKYYIIGLRGILRSLISRCVICRLRRGKARAPLMAPLPAGRVAARSRPFTHCGVDYFGPMLVKIGRRREKRWGVLFTCLTIRAVHLELAHSLNTSSAIIALQRLLARRGAPLVVYSDNGTNFRGADKELKELIAQLDRTAIAKFAGTRKIEWRFNPPDAPHMGGAWERLIRSVKIALHSILKEEAPSEEVLYTVLNEIEHSINSRPLTNVSLDPRDHEALTPNHFLLGSSSESLKLGKYDEKALCLRKEWKLAQHYADDFWKRWIHEYLPDLIPRKKLTEKEKPLTEGDLVLIVDLSSERNCWKKRTVTRVFPGKDKQVRVAEVRTPTGDYTRPVHKLIRLLSSDEH